jgi:hypothetical protein
MPDPKEPSLSDVQAGGHVELDDAPEDTTRQRRDAAEVTTSRPR